MGITTNPQDPLLKEVKDNGQQVMYLALPEEERAKGFVRPVRTRYKHVGIRPKGPTRPLTEEEAAQHAGHNYVCFEPYGPEQDPIVGRFWTQEQLDGGCGTITNMDRALAETYARNPAFYGATFCVHCGKHLPVGEEGEFVWAEDGTKVGT